MAKFSLQVARGHYFKQHISFSHFCSFYHQLDAILKTRPKSVLEIGPGNNLVSTYLKNLGIAVKTCDIDHRLKPDIVADIRSLPVKDKVFDTVIAFEVLEHIPYADVPQALDELARVAKKRVVVSIPHACASLDVGVRLYAIPLLRSFHGFSLRFPYFFKQIGLTKKNTQHYWEMGKRGYPKRKIMALFKKRFVVVDAFHARFNSYHYFLVLKVR